MFFYIKNSRFDSERGYTQLVVELSISASSLKEKKHPKKAKIRAINKEKHRKIHKEVTKFLVENKIENTAQFSHLHLIFVVSTKFNILICSHISRVCGKFISTFSKT